MRVFKLLIISAVSCLCLASCGEEFEKFEYIDFKTTGIKLAHPKNELSSYGEIGASGGEITFTATGKNAVNGYLSEIRVGDYSYHVTDTDLEQQLPYTICEKEWGRIELLSASPYTTRMVLFENHTNHRIDYELTFGGVFTISHIRITQSSKADQ